VERDDNGLFFIHHPIVAECFVEYYEKGIDIAA
jgi:hypothetical protein